MEETQGYDLGYSLPIHKVPAMLAAHTQNELPIMLLGRTGIGKTRVVEQYGEISGRHVVTIMGSQIEPTDPQGIPFPDFEQRVSRFLPHSVFASLTDDSILFLDEVNRARPEVQNALFRVILDRVAGELVLPRSVMIISAANPPTRPNMVYPLAAPLRDRFQIVPVVSDSEGWLNWAIRSGIHPVVAAFIKGNPQFLSPELPNDTTEMRGWPSPRSWESVSYTMRGHSDADIKRAKLLGTVGPKAGQSFMQFQAIGSKMPDPNMVLDGNVPFPSTRENASVVYATSISVAQLLIERVSLSSIGGKIMEKAFFVMTAEANKWPDEIIAVMSTAISASGAAVKAFTEFASSAAAKKMGIWNTEKWKVFQDAVNAKL